MNSECRRYFYYSTFLCVLLAAAISLGGCTNPEKAKAAHVSKGETYLKDLKFQEASLEFRNAIQIDDKFGPAHWGLARAYEGLQRLPEMLEELRKTIQLDQNNLDARTKLGNYYLAASRGKPELLAEAERLATEVLQKDPNHIEGHILMGSVLFAQNQKEKAFAELNHAIELDPKRVESYLSLARFYIVTRDNGKAEELFQRAISINPQAPLAHTEYGKFLAQSNRPDQAEAEFLKGVEVGPSDRNSRLVLATFYLANRKLDKAEMAFRALVDLDKDKPESQAVLADFYSAVNRTDDAVRIYKDILAKAPEYKQGRYRLAEILLVHGDTQAASDQIEQALKADAHDREALLLRARLRSKNGETEGLKAAVEDLKEVLNQEPNSRAGLYYMAQTTLNLGWSDQARSFASDLERNYPDYLPAKLLQIQISLLSGDAKGAATQATSLLERLAKTAPDRDNSPQLLGELSEKTFLARGTANAQLKNIAAARQDFEQAKQVAPTDPTVYINLATLSVAEKKIADAIDLYETALKNDAVNFSALNGLVNIWATTGELDKAHARIDQVLSSYPNNASVHFLQAEVYGFQHNFAGAEAELRKALELDSNYIAAYSALGALFINSKQEDRAIAEYQNIIQRRPEDPTAYTMIGMLEDSRKNYDAAIESYRKALQVDRNAAIAANNLAWIFAAYEKGNLDEAVRLAQGVVQRNPNIAGFVDTLGWVYYKKGLYAAAVDQLQKAVKIDEEAAKSATGSPTAAYHYHLGMALKAKGDRENSKRELETALRLSDKTPFADVNEARKALTTL
ncbi:MAG: tetratricopeptide repeat protein [Pyrinomonadaceae bacterium]